MTDNATALHDALKSNDRETVMADLRKVYEDRPHVLVGYVGESDIVISDDREEGLVAILSRSEMEDGYEVTEPTCLPIEHLDWIGED